MHKSGKTYQKIGDVFGITRQRAQQITFDELKKEIAEEKGFDYQFVFDKKTDNPSAGKTRKLVKIILKNRRNLAAENQREKIREEIRAKMKLVPHYSTFFTFRAYTKALKINEERVRRYFPDIAKKFIRKKGKKDPKIVLKIESCAHYSKFPSMNKYAEAIGIKNVTLKKYCPDVAKIFSDKRFKHGRVNNCQICGKKINYTTKTCSACLGEKTKKEIIGQMKMLPHYSTFSSLHSYSNAIFRDQETLKKYFPQIAEKLLYKRRKKNKLNL